MKRLTFGMLIACLSSVVQADVYKYTDNQGRVYYTDNPRNSLYQRIIKSAPKPVKLTNFVPPSFGGLSSEPLKIRGYMGAGSSGNSDNKKRYTTLIEQTAYKHQVDARLVHAVIQTESAYNTIAQSPKGAVGLMQLMPDTAKRFGVMDRNDPDQNVDGGTRYLNHLINLFSPNLELALAAYNAGENAVIRNNNSIPPYPETQNYVKQVLALYRPEYNQRFVYKH